MPHSITLITTIAASLGLALILGILANRLKLPALVGYLIAGVMIGPATPGFVADAGLSAQLAEIGVILLMFGVGLHFSFKDLLLVRRVALPGALVQIAVATALGMSVARFWGWSLGSSFMFGLALSVASTVVLVRALEQRGLIQSVNGRIAVGWLVVEDLAMVLALVFLPPLSGWLAGNAAGDMAGWDVLWPLLITMVKISVFVVLMLVIGRRLFPWLLNYAAGTGSRELFTLSVIAAAVGIAYGSSELFGASFALGAFLAGMIISESHLSHRAAEESLPLRDAFSVLFFVSVGMLFDPNILIQEPLKVIVVVTIIVVGKSLAAFLLILAFRYPLNTALTVSASLAQIGEFSFILAGLGFSLGLLSQQGVSLILAGALISIALNHLVFLLIEPAQAWIRSRSKLARLLERPDDPLAELPMTAETRGISGHMVVVGCGSVGRHIIETLQQQQLPFVVAEQNRELVESLREKGLHAVAGDASEPAVLIQAHIARAGILLITTPDTLRNRRMIEIARQLNPQVDILLRSHNEEETELLEKEGGGTILFAEQELAQSMVRLALEKVMVR
ncbi:YbaL family putative K(+) efflux transporter [Methylophaga sp. OBS4]|uniref:YbaL family putative K(+) efflux transporter n=1 Tax=Methylophaga sp. OBS4 TaxID=2991935 RepID=UPI00225633E8|nr:YbaL family putative K(+) efflux transporter [Methylophaga sp. OBS4]MCX4186983.1 Kef family K(+) transporter [Methylophaga sp. OBS4]